MKYFGKIDEEFLLCLVSLLTNCQTQEEMEKRRKELHIAADKAFEVAKAFKEGKFGEDVKE